MQCTLLLSLVMLFFVPGCATQAQVEETADAPAVSAPTAAPTAKVMPAVAAAPAAAAGATEDVPPPPKMAIEGAGICHIYGLPEGFDTKGLRIGGAVQGEILGEPIGGPMDYVSALTTCVNDPMCTGVTSTWYVGAPFRALKAIEDFRPDESSYGCTTLVGGRP
jgi:hypothetical protein